MRGHEEEDQHDNQREGEAEGAEAAESGGCAGAVEAGGWAWRRDDDGGEEGGAFVVSWWGGHFCGDGMRGGFVVNAMASQIIVDGSSVKNDDAGRA